MRLIYFKVYVAIHGDQGFDLRRQNMTTFFYACCYKVVRKPKADITFSSWNSNVEVHSFPGFIG